MLVNFLFVYFHSTLFLLIQFCFIQATLKMAAEKRRITVIELYKIGKRPVELKNNISDKQFKTTDALKAILRCRSVRPLSKVR